MAITKPINPFTVADVLGYYEYKPHPETGLSTRVVDWGRLCTHVNINEWSAYKPVNINSNVPSQAIKDALSGFKILNKQTIYDKPTGGSSSPYRIGDFDGYEHTSRRPQNTVINGQNFMTPTNGGTYGPSSALASISVTLPNTEVINRMKTQFGITHCSIYDSSDKYIGNQRMSLSTISETNYILFGSVILDLGDVPVGANYQRTCKIYYGNSTESYNMFQIPGGDSITINGTILANGVTVESAIYPTDSFLPYSISTLTHNSNYDPTSGEFTMSYLEMTGAGKNANGDTTKNNIMYNNFANKINWELRYRVYNGTGTPQTPELRVPNWSNLNAYITKWPTGQYGLGTWRIVNGAPFTLPYMNHGYKVVLRLYWTAVNWY